MAADNWGECPRCRAKSVAEAEDRVRAMEGSYGKVSAAEYKKLCVEAERPAEHNETFREDYEIGLHKDGTFCVNYGGGCDVCGFNFQYKHEEKVDY